MDILDILTQSGESLYPEDLDFFETELATGEGYSEVYRMQCLDMISKLRAWNKDDDEANGGEPTERHASNGLIIGLDDLAPKEANSAAANMAPAERFFREVSLIRKKSTYKSDFKNLLGEQTIVDAAFLEKHFSDFAEWELNAVVSYVQLGEEFLEKYFGALDHDKIARYQLFSEGFFMKHFPQLDHTIVLQHGKNEWRKKENRSKQLDVFLRLKGVKI